MHLAVPARIPTLPVAKPHARPRPGLSARFADETPRPLPRRVRAPVQPAATAATPPGPTSPNRGPSRGERPGDGPNRAAYPRRRVTVAAHRPPHRPDYAAKRPTKGGRPGAANVATVLRGGVARSAGRAPIPAVS